MRITSSLHPIAALEDNLHLETGIFRIPLTFSYFPLRDGPPQNTSMSPRPRPPSYRVVEDSVSRIDSPLLDDIGITFFNQQIFDTPYLRRDLGSHRKAQGRVQHATYPLPCGNTVPTKGTTYQTSFPCLFPMLTMVGVFISLKANS